MSEPTIAQTVLGSISLGAKLALTLYELAARVASVSTDIGRLARDITQFCSQLRQIEAVLKDEVNYSLSAEALSVLRKIAARSQECLEDLQQVADTVDSEASLHIPLKAESKDASRANSPNVFPNEKRRAWKPGSSNKNGGNPNGPEDGVKSQAEKVKFTLNRPRTLLVRQELDCLSIFLQLMVAICQSAQGSFRQGASMSDERETTELIAKNFLLTFEVSIKDLEAAEALFESGGLAPLRRPRSPLSKWRKDSATDETPVPSYQCPIERTSAFLRKATVGEMQDLDLLLPPCTSRASMKSALLAARWTIAARHSRATTVNSDDTFMLAAARSTSSAEATRQPEVSTTLQTWEELNTQWRSTVATAIFDLKTSASCRESSPLVTQLCAQISQLSTTCGTLTSALHELEMAHNTTKASYQHFLQSHVQNTETLVALNDKRDVQVAELTQQLSSRHPDLWAQVEQLKAELDASNAARYTLGREVDELRVELCARLQDVMRLTKVVNEHGEQAGVVLKEMSTLRDQNQKMRSTEELLRQRIASEKAQRLKAVQLLSGRLSGSGELLSPSKRDSIKGEQTVV